ncbi:MAG: hypothetical protein P4L43_14035 [Syntrophobacteraceae bacterium]|nr:hypothetical protein [Syntrophobacteraceae bacterium]
MDEMQVLGNFSEFFYDYVPLWSLWAERYIEYPALNPFVVCWCRDWT